MSRCHETIPIPGTSGVATTYCQLRRGHKGEHSPQPEKYVVPVKAAPAKAAPAGGQ